MELQAGKRYLRADGGITAPLLLRETSSVFKFTDGFGTAYKINGNWDLYDDKSSLDLIAEVPDHLIEKLIIDVLKFNGIDIENLKDEQ